MHVISGTTHLFTNSQTYVGNRPTAHNFVLMSWQKRTPNCFHPAGALRRKKSDIPVPRYQSNLVRVASRSSPKFDFTAGMTNSSHYKCVDCAEECANLKSKKCIYVGENSQEVTIESAAAFHGELIHMT